MAWLLLNQLVSHYLQAHCHFFFSFIIFSSPPPDPFVALPLHFFIPPHHSPSVGFPPSPLPSPSLLSAQSHQSSTSMRSSFGHNGDHMLKPALKPNTGRPHQIKPAVSSGAWLCQGGVKPYLCRPHQHAIKWEPKRPRDKQTDRPHLSGRHSSLPLQNYIFCHIY